MSYWKIIGASAAAALLAGCGGLGGRTWVPQGPGEYPEARAPAPRPQAAAAAQRPAAAAPSPRAPADAPPLPAGGYTQATRYGDLLFVSGQIAIDLATNQPRGTTIEEQTRQVMDNIRAIVESHRLTMANVVSVTVYLSDLKNFAGMDQVYESYFRGTLPARSVVEVQRLPRSALVEISVIAGR